MTKVMNNKCDDCNIPRLCNSIEYVKEDQEFEDRKEYNTRVQLGTRHVCDSCKQRYKTVWILKE